MLFVERARAVRPDFELTDETAPIVAEICERLDGLPLAVELAAAWSKVLPPAALLRRLERRLELPAARSADVPARQSTLRQAIAWSYDLLSDEERRLHARLSVFMGGFTLEAAERVAASDGESGRVLEGDRSLVDRSLLRETEDAAGEPRFAMLATIREFALEYLGESGEDARSVRLHALEFARFAEEAERGLRTGDQLLWFESTRDRARQSPRRARFVLRERRRRDGAASRRGARLVLVRAWPCPGGLQPPDRAARACRGRHRTSCVPARCTRSASSLTSAASPSALPSSSSGAWPSFASTESEERVASALNSLGLIKRWARRPRVGPLATRGEHRVRRELGDEAGAAGALSNLGVIAFEQGDLDEAEARFMETLELDRVHGNEWGAAVAAGQSCGGRARAGPSGSCARADPRTLAAAQRVGDQELIAFGLEKAAVLAAVEANAARAGRLAGVADALRESAGIDRSRFDVEWLDRHLGRVAGEEFEAAGSRGGRLEPDEALREAMGSKGSNP